MCTGLLVPVILSALEYLCPKNLNAKFHALFIYPCAWQKHWDVNIRDQDNITLTRGQGLYVLLTIGLNIGLSIPGLISRGQISWEWDIRDGKFLSCLANRLGALSLANLPLVFLYCGRNNFLLWVTSTLLFGYP
jgi:hypothetical protein